MPNWKNKIFSKLDKMKALRKFKTKMTNFLKDLIYFTQNLRIVKHLTVFVNL